MTSDKKVKRVDWHKVWLRFYLWHKKNGSNWRGQRRKITQLVKAELLPEKSRKK